MTSLIRSFLLFCAVTALAFTFTRSAQAASNGCTVSAAPGCGGCSCEAKVCGADPYCCTTAWDYSCLTECAGGCGVSDCKPDCTGKQCGPNGCGGGCGKCMDPNAYCSPTGQCGNVCTPNCAGKSCGDDGCGGTCGTCGADEACIWKTKTCAKICDATDELGCCTSEDKVATCKNGVAAASGCGAKEWCAWLGSVKGYGCLPTDQKPTSNAPNEHPRDCAAKKGCQSMCPADAQCGPDGCGGTCGTCAAGLVCYGLWCVHQPPLENLDAPDGGAAAGPDAGVVSVDSDALTPGPDAAVPPVPDVLPGEPSDAAMPAAPDAAVTDTTGTAQPDAAPGVAMDVAAADLAAPSSGGSSGCSARASRASAGDLAAALVALAFLVARRSRKATARTRSMPQAVR